MSRPPRTLARFTVGALGVLALVAACNRPGPREEIRERRTASAPSRPALPDAGPRERFGGFDMGSPAPRAASNEVAQRVFDYELPEGWVELALTQDRLVNVRPAGDPEAACTLTFLQGSAGGLEANVNRWRGQLGAEPLSGAAIAALPTHPLLGRTATVVEASGTFKGMGDTNLPGFALLGLIVSEPGGSLFLKFTGPEARVATEREHFLAFAGSLHLAQDHSTAPDVSAAAPHGPDDGTPHAEAHLSWTAPEGWREAAPRAMREVTFTVGQAGEAECYITRLGGDAGGLVANLSRWCSQFSRPALTQAQIDALPRAEMLGTTVPVLELDGSFEGMNGTVQQEQALLGVAYIHPEESVFVKFVGPESVVKVERERFLAFVKSIEEHGP